VPSTLVAKVEQDLLHPIRLWSAAEIGRQQWPRAHPARDAQPTSTCPECRRSRRYRATWAPAVRTDGTRLDLIEDRSARHAAVAASWPEWGGAGGRARTRRASWQRRVLKRLATECWWIGALAGS